MGCAIPFVQNRWRKVKMHAVGVMRDAPALALCASIAQPGSPHSFIQEVKDLGWRQTVPSSSTMMSMSTSWGTAGSSLHRHRLPEQDQSLQRSPVQGVPMVASSTIRRADGSSILIAVDASSALNHGERRISGQLVSSRRPRLFKSLMVGCDQYVVNIWPSTRRERQTSYSEHATRCRACRKKMPSLNIRGGSTHTPMGERINAANVRWTLDQLAESQAAARATSGSWRTRTPSLSRQLASIAEVWNNGGC